MKISRHDQWIEEVVPRNDFLGKIRNLFTFGREEVECKKCKYYFSNETVYVHTGWDTYVCTNCASSKEEAYEILG